MYFGGSREGGGGTVGMIFVEECGEMRGCCVQVDIIVQLP